MYNGLTAAVFDPASQHLGEIMMVGGHMACTKHESIMVV